MILEMLVIPADSQVSVLTNDAVCWYQLWREEGEGEGGGGELDGEGENEVKDKGERERERFSQDPLPKDQKV